MHHVFAYIDPTSGSMVIQALIAGLVAAPFVLRTQIARVIRRFRGEPRVTTQPTPARSDIDPAG